jgi:hypothetical protein
VLRGCLPFTPKGLPMMQRLTVFSALLLATSCGLFGGNSKDPLEKMTARVDLYVTNTPTTYPTEMTGTSGSTWSNRPVQFTFQGGSDEITKFELKRLVNGVETVCEMKNVDGNPMVNTNLRDWAAASTQYTLVITADTFTKTFGPYDITVQSAERVVTFGATLTDQTNDQITTGGAFFQTRTVDIGGGGYTGANFNSTLAQYQPRLLDFALLTTGGALKIVSPSLIHASATIERLKNDCGFQTTTFAAYTGSLDPQTAPLTLAEVAALADPPASATSIAPTAGLKFVYKTSDGKKGLIKVKTVAATSITLEYSSAQ